MDGSGGREQSPHEMDQERPYRIQNFDPLLRDLVAWGLVVRSENEGESSWQLVDVVQRRLSELTRNHGPIGLDQLVYLDHKCADCGARGLTRLVDDVYLCAVCFDRRAGGAAPAEATEPSAPHRAMGFFRHHPRPAADGGGRTGS